MISLLGSTSSSNNWAGTNCHVTEKERKQRLVDSNLQLYHVNRIWCSSRTREDFHGYSRRFKSEFDNKCQNVNCRILSSEVIDRSGDDVIRTRDDTRPEERRFCLQGGREDEIGKIVKDVNMGSTVTEYNDWR